MRILHTSDWHLGQEFHGYGREPEHEAFLGWLADALVEHRVDALIVAGDIYDSQNPPIAAQKQLYGFIAKLRSRMADIDIVLVGGNHDSAGRLEAPGPLLEPLGVVVVGAMARTSQGGLDIERLVVPLRDHSGAVRGLCAAVPFLRLSDLPPAPDDSVADPLVWGVRQVYGEIFAAIGQRLAPDQALIATGHCYMTGGEVSELSERRILGGNQHALPADIFPDSVTYVALGHLHKAQRVGGLDHVRYCGSPLPLSVAERDYRHQVLLVDVDGPAATVTSLPVPRMVDIIRIPARGGASPEVALAALRALSAEPEKPRAQWPYVHVAVIAGTPLAGLRRDVDEAIAGKGLRLARIEPVNERPSPVLTPEDLPDLENAHPEEVFVQCWRGKHDDDPGPDYIDAFRQLLEGCENGEATS